MKHIELVTFAGCQLSAEYKLDLTDYIEDQGFDASVEMVIVPTAERAAEYGMRGSPTIRVDGVEYQAERQGPLGFYSRAHLTAEGFRAHPSVHELLHDGAGVDDPSEFIAEPCRPRFPVLLSAAWCGETRRAMDLWQGAAHSTGMELTLLDAESHEGSALMHAAKVAGVPCLLLGLDQPHYGVPKSLDEAVSLLTGRPR